MGEVGEYSFNLVQRKKVFQKRKGKGQLDWAPMDEWKLTKQNLRCKEKSGSVWVEFSRLERYTIPYRPLKGGGFYFRCKEASVNIFKKGDRMTSFAQNYPNLPTECEK